MSADKVREDRLRRAARRQGLVLHKSRTRDPRALDYQSYWLVDQRTDVIVAGDPAYGGLDLDGVELHLTGS